MTTLIEPFIFNRVSADIKRFIAGEQQQAISDDAGHFVPDESVPREDFYEDLHVHFSFLDLLLTVRFNEHASLDKAANLGISRYIKGYASLFDRMEEKAPQLFDIEEGYVVANTKEGEAYFESLAYKDIEDVVENVRSHLLALEGVCAGRAGRRWKTMPRPCQNPEFSAKICPCQIRHGDRALSAF